MIVGILSIIIAMLVYILYYIKTEFTRVIDRIDNGVVGIARINRELMRSTLEVLAQSSSISDTNEAMEDEEEEVEEEDEIEEEMDDDIEEDVDEEIEDVGARHDKMVTVHEDSVESEDCYADEYKLSEVDDAVVTKETVVDGRSGPNASTYIDNEEDEDISTNQPALTGMEEESMQMEMSNVFMQLLQNSEGKLDALDDSTPTILETKKKRGRKPKG